MNPLTLETIAQQATNILLPALPFLTLAGKSAVDKGKEVLEDMAYEKVIEKLGSESGKRAKALLEKISPKMTASLEKALTKASRNSEDPKAKGELQQEILKILRENPDLAREIEIIVNINLKIDLVKQLVFGDNNLILNLEGVQGEELIKVLKYMEWKRQEELIQEVQRSYSPSALPDYSKNLTKFVTENRAEELSHALNRLQENKILLFSGIAGVGKTTLARVLIDFRPTGVPEPFWFDFHHNRDANLEDVLEALAAYLEAPEILSFKGKRQAGKPDINRLTEELRKRNSLWLVFDDLSYMINENRNFIDPGLGLLFTSLRDNTHRAKVILTSRIMPLLDNGEYLIDELEDENRQEIKGLKTDFAVNYLKENGLDKIELDILESLVESVDGHPFSLKLLVGLTKKHTPENILKDLSFYRKHQEDRIKKARFLFDKLVGGEKELLERIAVYRQPEPPEAIKIMSTDNTPIDSVDILLDKSLLETNHNGKYWLHPLVKEFSYDDLVDKKVAHMLAVKYYLSLPLPEKPSGKEDVQPLIEAHHHACMMGEYEKAALIIEYSNLDYLLDLWGYYRELVKLYSLLLPENPFNSQPLLSLRQHGIIIGNLGKAYYQLGQIRTAIEYHNQALKIAIANNDEQNEGICRGNLGLAYIVTGEMEKALEHLNASLVITRNNLNLNGEQNILGYLGNIYLNQGYLSRAQECYQKALEITKIIKNKRDEGTWLGNLGLIYDKKRDTKKAIEHYEKALVIARELGDKRNEGIWLINLGGVYLFLRDTEKAVNKFQKAVAIARELEDLRMEQYYIGSIGVIHYQLKEFDEAIKCYEQALEIARKIGSRLEENNHLNNLIVVYKDLENPIKVIEYCEKALKIVREIGNRIEEKNYLDNLGLEYKNLGNPLKAIECYKQALKIAQSIGDRLGESVYIGNMGLSYSQLGEQKKAIELLKKSIDIGKEIKNREVIKYFEQEMNSLGISGT